MGKFLRAALQAVLLAAIFMAALIGLFVAWWIVVLALLVLSGYLAVRRFLGPRQQADRGPVVIEGEFLVERGSPPPPVVEEPEDKNAPRR